VETSSFCVIPFLPLLLLDLFSDLGLSDFDDLRGLHDGVLSRDGLSPRGLVVVGAVVAVGVAVLCAEKVPAAAPESRESHAPPAAGAAVHGAFGLRRRRLVRLRFLVEREGSLWGAR